MPEHEQHGQMRAHRPGSDHGHDESHGHTHHGHAHDHSPGTGWWNRLRHKITPHSHDSADKVDSALESSREGLRALWISLVALGITAALQAIIVVFSGSVALLGDTLHNFADALTAIPLGIAFLLGRRAATRAYTYGFGRAEDLAGIVIVAFIAASAVAAGWTAINRLLNPQDMRHMAWVFAAGVIGFIGNELVARYRITVGRRIGSAALVADGLHARTDGFTSLAVLAAAGGTALGWGWADPVVGLAITVAILLVLTPAGSWLGWHWADPIVGLAITVAIAFVLRDAAREVYRRLMDRVDPELVDQAEASLRAIPGVRDISGIRLRWIGHRMHAEADIVVDAHLSLLAAHEIAADAEHQLTHSVPRLTRATVHVDPASHPGAERHTDISHHRRGRLAEATQAA
jgi:divalent metal cation (Fe/Co/Zn/Cd) transporter